MDLLQIESYSSTTSFKVCSIAVWQLYCYFDASLWTLCQLLSLYHSVLGLLGTCQLQLVVGWEWHHSVAVIASAACPQEWKVKKKAANLASRLLKLLLKLWCVVLVCRSRSPKLHRSSSRSGSRSRRRYRKGSYSSLSSRLVRLTCFTLLYHTPLTVFVVELLLLSFCCCCWCF